MIRILDKSNAMLQLSELGFLPDSFDRYESRSASRTARSSSQGRRIGKSTTLYATLNIVNQPDRHIVTVEDPSSTGCRVSTRSR